MEELICDAMVGHAPVFLTSVAPLAVFAGAVHEPIACFKGESGCVADKVTRV
jgi:hypothetical protein